jgi:aldehyde dehydrogenase family 7 protein A1
MIVAKRAIFRLNAAHLTRGLSSRASTILSSLGISTTEELSGVYDGEWKGSGEIFKSICPTTGETLARIKTATPQELHDALGRTREAYTVFRSAYSTSHSV